MHILRIKISYANYFKFKNICGWVYWVGFHTINFIKYDAFPNGFSRANSDDNIVGVEYNVA